MTTSPLPWARPSSALMKKVFGLDRGFELYDDENYIDHGPGVGELNGRTAEDVTRAAKRFVDEHASEPFFLFLNYYDPHAPYAPHPEHMGHFWNGAAPDPKSPPPEWNIALYDAEIRYTDQHLGELFDHLKLKGLYEDMWILVTADHGELMGEHGAQGHGNSLSQEEIHIPLLVKEPGPTRRRGRVDQLVGQVDFLPTILARLGIAARQDVQGMPFDADSHRILAEVYPLPMMNSNPDLADRQLGDWQVLLRDDYKYVHGSRGKHYLFDLEADPRERRNLIETEPEVAEAMRAELESLLESLPEPGPVGDVDIDPKYHKELLQQMKAMGYIGDEEGEGN